MNQDLIYGLKGTNTNCGLIALSNMGVDVAKYSSLVRKTGLNFFELASFANTEGFFFKPIHEPKTIYRNRRDRWGYEGQPVRRYISYRSIRKIGQKFPTGKYLLQTRGHWSSLVDGKVLNGTQCNRQIVGIWQLVPKGAH